MSRSQFEKTVTKLFSLSRDISSSLYSCNQIEGLPSPVRRYFNYALRENQPFISSVRLKHGGEFRPHPNLKWFSIKGEEYFTVENPGFCWLGKIPLATATDTYVDGKGNLKVKLLSLIKFIDARGKETDQGELYRWLAEAPWFPTALLPSERLRWEAVDDSSAKIIFSDKGLKLEGTFYFNGQGQITVFKAKRYMGKNELVNWSCYYKDYREVNCLQIPLCGEVVWNLDAGDYAYGRFKIEKIEYDLPKVFSG